MSSTDPEVPAAADRRALLNGYRDCMRRRTEGARDKSLDAAELDALYARAKQFKHAYFARLPRIPMSRCPLTGQPLLRAFDPYGFDGLWWQERELTAFEEPAAPRTFAVLTGAVDLRGLPATGGDEQAHIGPGAPFVIPRLLQLPTLECIVMALPMQPGYTAYAIAYFAVQAPPPGSLTSSWRCTSYGWRDARGEPAFSYPTDPWDFELAPWIERGKLKWILPGDPQIQVRSGAASQCPYVNLPGARERQIVRATGMHTVPPPNGETIDPFAE